MPHTDGLNQQKIEGLDSVGRWWSSCLSEARIVGMHKDELSIATTVWPQSINKRALWEAYQRHAHQTGERHPKAENSFPSKLKEMAPTIRTKQMPEGERVWLFQKLEVHRDEFLEAMRIERYDWPDPEEDKTVTPFKTRA